MKPINRYREWLRKQNEYMAEALSRLTPNGISRTLDGMQIVCLCLGFLGGIGLPLMFEIYPLLAIILGLSLIACFIIGLWEMRVYTKIRIAVEKAAKVVSP